jgi:alpha-tubulin suppressor-like RCC1 family protein
MGGGRRYVLGMCVVGFVVALAVATGPAWAGSGYGFAWGGGTYGQLGDGVPPEYPTEPESSDVPVHIGELSEVRQLAGGEHHSLALLLDGQVMAWGSNGDGQLGDGSTKASYVPTAVDGSEEVTAIAASSAHSYGLLADGQLEAWGGNEEGGLGDGTTEKSDVPVLVSGLGDVTAVAAGGNFGLALLGDGTVMAWGGNEHGQLGDGSTERSLTPVPISGLSDAVAVAAGTDFSLALLGDGEVRSWGADDTGELGDGGSCDCTQSTTPIPVSGLSEAVAISAGYKHSLALLPGGTVEAWGENKYGELGDGTKDQRDAPVAVQHLSGVSAVAAGGYHSIALLSGGTVVDWGGNEEGELGAGGSAYIEGSEVPLQVICGLRGVVGIASGFYTALAWGGENELCPAILSLAPSEGPPAGGTAVTITGSGFTGASAVNFGSAPASSFTVESATTIKAVAPAGAETVEVRVTTANGRSAERKVARFTYGASPSVTGLSPGYGSADGEGVVFIRGTDLGNATAVDFGSTPATSFYVGGSNEIQAYPPAGTGVVDVTVTDPSGTSLVTTSDRYVYSTSPEVGRCLVGAPGEWKTSKCDTEGEDGGKYSWFPAFGAKPLSNPSFTLSGGAVKLETAHLKIECSASAAHGGEYTGQRTLTVGVLTLTGCVQHKGASCASTGAAAGEVRTAALDGELGYAPMEHGRKVGVALSPAGGEVFAEFTCGATAVLVTGAVILEVPSAKMLTSASWKAKQKKGIEVATSFEGGPEMTLHARVGGSPSEPIGLKATITETSGEAVEIVCDSEVC